MVIDETVVRGFNGSADGIVIKYSETGEVEWAKPVGTDCASTEQVYCCAATSDGGVIVGGYFTSDSIRVGDQILYDSGSWDSMIVKYDKDGEIEWGQTLGSSSQDICHGICETKDGNYVAIGKHSSRSLWVGDYLLESTTSSTVGYIVKYGKNGEVLWASNFDGASNDDLKSVVGTDDGGFLIAGQIYGTTRTAGGITVTNGNNNFNGILVKYDAECEPEWMEIVGGPGSEDLYNVSTTNDGGFIVSGHFSNTLTIGPFTLTGSSTDALVIKYDKDYNVVWATQVGGSGGEEGYSVAETLDGGAVLAGHYYSHTMELGDYTLYNMILYDVDLDGDGMIVKLLPQMPASEQTNLTINNNRKQFKITTRIDEIDGIKGGTISGEDLFAYEKVKYGDSSTKEIVMTPDSNYKIIGITVNGEEWPFEEAADGSYTMPQFDNVTEDKRVAVSYTMKDNTITINKIDDTTGEKLANAEFKIDQIEEREEVDNDNILGSLTDNGPYYYDPIYTEDVTDTVLGDRLSNSTYRFVEKEGTLVPTNSKTYRVENGLGEEGVGGTTANSHFRVDLRGLDGDYVAVVNARVSSQSGVDYGYSTITTSTSVPAYNTYSGVDRFMRISGTQDAQDYVSDGMHGGNVYYLHLGYRKNNTTDTDEDQVVFNDIKIYKASKRHYNFIEQDGAYISTISDMQDTTCSSYIPLDLTDYTGYIMVTVNAEVKSSDYNPSYIYITDSTDYPTSGTTIMHKTYSASTPTDYSKIVEGGHQYYLHFVYTTYPDSDPTKDNYLKINSISASLSDYGFYHTSATTNVNGQAITQIPFAKYQITEVKAPDGYFKLEEPLIIDFRSGDDAQHEFTIENEKQANVIVHHYLKGTTTKVAEDDKVIGKIGADYSTSPKVDLINYELEIDENDNYVLPDNATGTFTREDQEVAYYYVPKKDVVFVNHYLVGTETPVTLNDGTSAETIIKTGNEGETYETEPLTTELHAKYELDGMPENATGTYDKAETIVNYYYRIKSFEITTEVNTYEQTNILGEIETIKGGTITGEDQDVLEKVRYGENAINDIIIEADVGYKIKSITVNGTPEDLYDDYLIEIPAPRGVDEDIHIIAEFEKEISTVIVHHYLEGTTNKVPKAGGGVVEDEVKTGAIGSPYATKESTEIADGYMLASRPSQTSGVFTEDPLELTYYYKAIPEYDYRVEYYYNDIIDNDNTVTESAREGTEITTYTDKVKTGYKFKEVIGTPLTVTSNIATNVIKVYYETDPTQTKTLKYTVKYYKDNVLQPDDTIEKSVVVQELEPNTLTLDRSLINNTTKYTGYYLDHTDPATVPDEVNNGTVIGVYYRIRTDIPFIIAYVEKGTNTPLAAEEIGTGRYGLVIRGEDEAASFDGYTYDSSDPEQITLLDDQAQNLITIYYVKRSDIHYTVNYLEKGTNNVLRTAKTGTATFEEVINAANEEIPIDGYYHDSNNPASITIKTDESQNVLNIYYTKRNDIHYTVNYLEKGTNNVIQTAKTGTATFDATINAVDEEIPIDGYYHDSNDPASITIKTDESQNVLNIYYTKRNDIHYTVNYLEKGTDNVVSPAKTAQATFEEVINAVDEEIPVDGYEHDSNNPDSITIKTDESQNVLNIYYTKRVDLTYTVNYLEKDSDKVLHDPKVVNTATFEETINAVDEEIPIEGYYHDSNNPTSITIKTDSTQNVINIYYTKRADLTYTVNYLEKDSNKVLHDPKVVNTATLEETINAVDEEIPIDGYNHDSNNPDSITIKVDSSQNVINIYYTKRTNINYTVNYLEKGTDNVVSPAKTAQATFEETINAIDEEIPVDGYNHDSNSPDSIVIKTDESQNVLNIYYTKKTDINYTINYLEKGTNNVVSPAKTAQATFEETINAVDEEIPVDGYNHDSNDPDSIVIKTDESQNILNIYYTKRTDINYTVNYLEKGTDNVVSPAKTAQATFEEVVNAVDEEIPVDGYEHDSNNPDSITIKTDESQNVLNIYYTKRGDIEYTVNYLEKDTEKVLETAKTKTAAFEETIYAVNEEIPIDGYEHDSNNPESITIKTDTTQNVLNIYYTKRTDIEYTVNYLEKDTDKVLETAKTGEATFEEVIKADDEIIPIDGYNHDSNNPEEITIGIDSSQNVINIYYKARTDLSYTVNYIDEATNRTVHDPKEVHDATYGETIKAEDEVIDVDGYRHLSSSPEQITIGIDDAQNVITIFYTKRSDLTYTIRYIDKETNLDIIDPKVEDKVFGTIIYANSEIIEMEKYDFVESDKEYIEVGTNEAENVISLFYTKKDGNVYVHYYKEGTTEKLADEVILTGKVDTEYHTLPVENVDENYELVGDPTNKDGIYTVEPIEVNYFYKLKDARLVIEYKEKGSDDILLDTHEEDTKRLATYNLEDFIKDIDGYVLDRQFTNEEFTIDQDIVTKTIYYEPLSKVMVHYADIDTREDLETSEEEGIVGDRVDIHSINIDGYVLKESPAEESVEITKEVKDVYYYYKKISEGLVEKHIDNYDNSILYEEVYTGEVGDEYIIYSREFDKYELDETKLPDNFQGTLKDTLIEVVYYYDYQPVVTIKYVDEATGEDLVDPIIINGKVGDDYTSEQKDIEKYSFVEVIGEPEGTLINKDVLVTYKYERLPNKVIENHIDIATGEPFSTIEQEKYPGEEYTTSPIEDYIYEVIDDKLPDNASGEMGEDDIVVNYYYNKLAKVVVEYLDFFTGESIALQTNYKGYVGDEYNTEPAEIEGYKLVEEQLPENASGTMTEENILVTYFYVKAATVKERHVYKDQVLYEETHEGYEGEEYNIEPRIFDYYIVDKDVLPTNNKGFMGEEEIVVTYRYAQKAIVVEKHIDEETKNILAYETHEGKVGEDYNIPARTFKGYDRVYATTSNNRGQMTIEPIEVIFSYSKVKNETPAKEEPKTQQPAQQPAQQSGTSPVTVIVTDGGTTTRTVVEETTTRKVEPSASNTVVKNVVANTAPTETIDKDVVVNVPDTESNTNVAFYIASRIIVLIGAAIVTFVAIINKKKNN